MSKITFTFCIKYVRKLVIRKEECGIFKDKWAADYDYAWIGTETLTCLGTGMQIRSHKGQKK